LSFLGQRAALLVEHGLDTFGSIPLGGIHASLGVESDVLGFSAGGRGGGGLGKATGSATSVSASARMRSASVRASWATSSAWARSSFSCCPAAHAAVKFSGSRCTRIAVMLSLVRGCRGQLIPDRRLRASPAE